MLMPHHSLVSPRHAARVRLRLLAGLVLATMPAAFAAQQPDSPVALLRQQSALLRLAPDNPAPSHVHQVDAAGRVALIIRSGSGDLSWSIALPASSQLPPITAENIAATYGGSFALLAPAPSEEPPGGLVIPMLPGQGAYSYLIRFDTPVPGPHTLQLFALAPVSATPVLVDATLLDSDVGVAAMMTEPQAPQGTEAVAAFVVVEQEAGLAGATVAATVVRPDYTRVSLPARDDGLEWDGTAGDGMYTVVFNTQIAPGLFEPVGPYTILADITGTNALGNAFVRNTATTFEVIPRCAELPANFEASTFVEEIDTDQPPDLCLDVIEFAVSGVVAHTAGTYGLKLGLYPQGMPWRRFTAEGETQVSAAQVGVPTVLRARVAIRGRDLWLFRPARSLVVESAALAMVVDGARFDCGVRGEAIPGGGLLVTQPIASQMYAGWSENWTGDDQTEVFDLPEPEGDGFTPWDGLGVRIGLQFHFTGMYDLQAWLFDSCGTLIDGSEQRGFFRYDGDDDFGLLGGVKQATFAFSGQKIGATATSGRFSVRVRATSINALENIEDHVYVTPFLHFSDFVGLLDRSPAGGDGGWHDINRNGVSDACEVAILTIPDVNGNGVWDVFEPFGNGCTPDYNRDGVIDLDDLGDFMTHYFDEEFPPGSVPPCLDFNGDGVVNSDDLGDFITRLYERDWNSIITEWCQANAAPCDPCGGHEVWMPETCP